MAKKYAEGLGERRGFYGRPSFPKEAVWVHAVSVGEVQSAWPVLEGLADAGEKVLLSTTTATGRETAFQLADGLFARHIYYPWDVPRIVRRALGAVQPKAFITVETEIWPSMLGELRRRNIPAFLVNGRFSEKTARQAQKRAVFWKDVYDLFTLLLVRSGEDRRFLVDLGISEEKIKVTGDCKIDGLLMRRQRADLAEAKAIAGEGGPVFLAGSTHRGEDEIVLKAFSLVRRQLPDARLILAPRHPERACEVLPEASAAGRAALLSEVQRGSENGAAWEILVIDRVGVLFGLYGVCDAAFIGGSLVDRGGQNIMEPAAFGLPFCHGPYMRDFEQAAKELGDRGAATLIKNEAEISAHWIDSLNPPAREKVRNAADSYFALTAGAARKTVEEILPLLPVS
ncbi:MAG: 3-deoxy-D-manno-octulosonic acid transferase [Aminivibrio sp.]